MKLMKEKTMSMIFVRAGKIIPRKAAGKNDMRYIDNETHNGKIKIEKNYTSREIALRCQDYYAGHHAFKMGFSYKNGQSRGIKRIVFRLTPYEFGWRDAKAGRDADFSAVLKSTDEFNIAVGFKKDQLKNQYSGAFELFEKIE